MKFVHDEKRMRMTLAVMTPVLCLLIATVAYRRLSSIDGFSWFSVLFSGFLPSLLFIFGASLSTARYEIDQRRLKITVINFFGLRRRTTEISLSSIKCMVLTRMIRGQLIFAIDGWDSEVLFSYGRITGEIWEFFKDSLQSLAIGFEEEEEPDGKYRRLNFMKRG